MRRCAVALLSLVACARDVELAAPQPPIAIEVEYAGCDEVRRGPVCDVAPGGSLVVWARAEKATELTVEVEGGQAVTSTLPAIDDGVRWTVSIPADARAVVVRGSVAGGPRVVIPIAHEARPPELAEADTLRASGKFAEAEKVLAALGEGRSDTQRARVIAKRARLALALGRTEEAIALFRQAIPLDHEGGLLSAEIDDRAALGYALIYRTERFGEADEVLRPLESLAREVPQGRTTASYFMGLLDHQTGDLRAAAARLRAARDYAARLGMEGERRAALSMELDALWTMGQRAQATVLLDELREQAGTIDDVCVRAQTLYNVARYGVLGQLEGSEVVTPGTVRQLQDVLELTRAQCPSPSKLIHYTATLTEALLRVGRVDEAQQLLSDLPPIEGAPPVVLLYATAELALAKGDSDAAIAVFADVRKRWPDAPSIAWRAAVGAGRAYRMRGDTERAIAAFQAAEDTLDGYAFLVPYGGGHATFLDVHGASARLLVDALLAEHRENEAWEVARHARRRGLGALAWRARVESLAREKRSRWYDALSQHRRERALIDADAGDDWKLSADRLLRARRTREARLARIDAELEAALASVAPLPAAGSPQRIPAGTLSLLTFDGVDGVVLFAMLDAQLTVLRLGQLDPKSPPEELAAQMLTPLDALLTRSKAVVIWSSGVWDEVDVHALPYRARPLIASIPVAYALDLAQPPQVEARWPVNALIVDDSQGDLPGSRQEAAVVESAIVSSGGRVRRLVGDSGTRAAVVRALQEPEVGLLHIAGHAIYEGIDGWNSHIRLAYRDQLSVADILALERVPSRVVLSGCETARGVTGVATSLSLAHALILVGATEVLATTRPVDDAQAAKMMATLYGSPAIRDLSLALHAANNELDARSPSVDWASFRVVHP